MHRQEHHGLNPLCSTRKSPRTEVVSQGLKSCGDRHEVGRRLNNRVENSHQPFRRRERAMQRFRSAKTLQKLSSVHAQVHNHFNRNVISSAAKSTNRDARLRWPNGAQSWPDPPVEFLSRQTHTVVHRSRFCLTSPPGNSKHPGKLLHPDRRVRSYRHCAQPVAQWEMGRRFFYEIPRDSKRFRGHRLKPEVRGGP
jgi:hypothetical protein